MRFGLDGDLYIADSGSHNVLRFDGTTGAFISEVVQARSGGLFRPQSMAIGPDGDFYVASSKPNVILRYDGVTGNFKHVIVAKAGLTYVNSLRFIGNDLYVTSSRNDSISRLVPDAVTMPCIANEVSKSLFYPLHEAPIDVYTVGDGFLNAWADLNNDGELTQVEQIVTNQAVSSEIVRLNLTIPADFGFGPMLTRFQITSALVENPDPSVDGPDGEVENKIFNVRPNTAPRQRRRLTDFRVLSGKSPREFSLRKYFRDYQDETLSYQVVSSDDTIVHPVISGEKLILQFATNNGGLAKISVTASDINGAQTTSMFYVRVNQIPEIMYAGGVLKITGTPRDDMIVLDREGELYVAYAVFYLSRHRFFATRRLQEIFVNVGDGNDSVILTSSVQASAVIRGGDGDDILQGGMGNDLIFGEGGADQIFGGRGNDILFGGQSDDHLDGAYGNDVLVGNEGNDELFGQLGNDILIGGLGTDLLDDTEGHDLLVGGSTANETRRRALLAAILDWENQKNAAALRRLGSYTNDQERDEFTGNLRGDRIKR